MKKSLHSIIYTLIAILIVSTSANNDPASKHPRPDFRRDEWLNLNGTWNVAFDLENKGESEGWNRADWSEWPSTLTIPNHWKDTFSETTWYQRTFAIPTGWMDKTILLHIGPVNWRAKVWIDGNFLCEHNNDPLSLPINSALANKQEHTLTIKASNHSKPKSADKKQWQGVYLDVTPVAGSVFIQDIHIETTRDGMLFIDVTPKGKFKNQAHTVLLPDVPTDGYDPAASIHSSDAYEGLHGECKVETPQRWTRETPVLYYMKVNLFDGSKMVDSIHTQFAFR